MTISKIELVELALLHMEVTGLQMELKTSSKVNELIGFLTSELQAMELASQILDEQMEQHSGDGDVVDILAAAGMNLVGRSKRCQALINAIGIFSGNAAQPAKVYPFPHIVKAECSSPGGLGS